jgi:hypothetical protein
MRVGIISFGSVWRRRFGRDAADPERFRRAAYFNTSGVVVNGRMVHHRKIAGHVRFNGVGGFNPHYPQRMIGSIFECDGPCIWNGQNKVFFGRRLDYPERPDCFLVAIRSAEFGLVSVGANGWKSDDAWLISFSEWRGRQELLMLLPPDGWVQTELGRAALSPDSLRPWVNSLELCEVNASEVL